MLKPYYLMLGGGALPFGNIRVASDHAVFPSTFVVSSASGSLPFSILTMVDISSTSALNVSSGRSRTSSSR
jgi:hypothetical protein